MLERKSFILDNLDKVNILVPKKYKTIVKHNRQTKCTNWRCSYCFYSSMNCFEKIDCWKDDISPRLIPLGSNKKFKFSCDKCSHIFYISPKQVTSQKQWCPFCSNQKLCDDEKCEICFKKSFANEDKAQFWSSKNTLKPRLVFKKSSRTIFFNCYCGHEFSKKLSDISWCPYCSNPPQKLCNDYSCESCYNNSFESHEKSKYWSIKNKISPRYVFNHAVSKYIFLCECDHEFISTPNFISTNNGWCPYCSNKKLCQNDSCENCYKKSFASHKKAKYWSDVNKKSPREFLKNSSAKIVFKCEKNHVFKSKLGNIVSGGTWCPICRISKRERLIEDFLKENSIIYGTQFKLFNNRYKYDFIIGRFLVEYDGIQHFFAKSIFKGKKSSCEEYLIERKNCDMIKDSLINKSSFYLIRLDYTLKDEEIIDIIRKCAEFSIEPRKINLTDKFIKKKRVYYSNKKLYEHLITAS